MLKDVSKLVIGKDKTAREILDMALAQLHLSWAEKVPGQIKIMSSDEYIKDAVLELYDVRELLNKITDFAGPDSALVKKGDEAKLEKAKERIRNRVREHEGKGEMERKQLEESATRSIEGAARKGVPVEHAEKTVEKGIDRGMKGEEIEKMTRAMAYGADKGTDYEELGKFMDRKMVEGERGDDLAMSVYKEIDDKHALKQQEKMEEKLPWYKRWFKRN